LCYIWASGNGWQTRLQTWEGPFFLRITEYSNPSFYMIIFEQCKSETAGRVFSSKEPIPGPIAYHIEPSECNQIIRLIEWKSFIYLWLFFSRIYGIISCHTKSTQKKPYVKAWKETFYILLNANPRLYRFFCISVLQTWCDIPVKVILRRGWGESDNNGGDEPSHTYICICGNVIMKPSK
jgi:hypothetical protein